jgi:hypothetical protein
MQTNDRKRYKLGNARDEEEINKVKQRLQIKRAALSEPPSRLRPAQNEIEIEIVDLEADEAESLNLVSMSRPTPFPPMEESKGSTKT